LTYRVRNVSGADREVTLEHQSPAGRALVDAGKPVDGSSDLYRFVLPVAAGQVMEKSLRELDQSDTTLKLGELTEEQARPLLASGAVSDQAKAVLRQALKLRSDVEKKWFAALETRAALKAIVDEQGRLRANLERLPQASAAYKRYLEKFDSQETQIEKLQAQIDEADKAHMLQQKEFSDFLAKAAAN
jgi:hypothetical protein